MALVWTNDMNTGIDVIDSQHMRIVEYINQLEKAARRQDQQLVGHVLGELVDYTLSHFAFEESLQEEAGYAFAKPHKSVHDTFVKRIAKYQERHNGGRMSSNKSTTRYAPGSYTISSATTWPMYAM